MAKNADLIYMSDCPECKAERTLHVNIGSAHAQSYPAHCEQCGFEDPTHVPAYPELELIRRVRQHAKRAPRTSSTGLPVL